MHPLRIPCMACSSAVEGLIDRAYGAALAGLRLGHRIGNAHATHLILRGGWRVLRAGAWFALILLAALGASGPCSGRALLRPSGLRVFAPGLLEIQHAASHR